MELTSHPNRTGFRFFPGLIGFIFAFRTCLSLIWAQEDQHLVMILSASLSLLLLFATIFQSTGAVPSIPSECFRTPTIRWIGAFFGLALVSLFWTAAPLIEAAGYWAAWISDIITIWFLLREGSIQALADAVMKGYIWGTCIVAIIAWSIPVMSDLRLGDEQYLHPNAIGFVTAVATLMTMYLAHENKHWRWLAFGLAMTLLRTISKTSIIAFSVAMIFYLFKDATLTRGLKIKIGVAGAIITGSLWGLLATYLTTYSEGAGPETLTGRTVIWSTSGEIALETPYFGHGFYSFHFLVPLIGLFQAGHAHNELLQQFFILGIPGVILVVGIYWAIFRQIRRSPKSRIKTLATVLLIFALIRGLTDTERNDFSYPLWLMTMLSIILASLSIPSRVESDAQSEALIA